jgi:hypothetical protein
LLVQLELNKAASDVASWPYLDHDYRGQLHELDEINAESAGLAPICTYTFPKSEGSQTASIVYDGTLYAAIARYAGALNCRQGSSREGQPPERPFDPRPCFLGTDFDVPSGMWAMHSYRSDSGPLGGAVIGGAVA